MHVNEATLLTVIYPYSFYANYCTLIHQNDSMACAGNMGLIFIFPRELFEDGSIWQGPLRRRCRLDCNAHYICRIRMNYKVYLELRPYLYSAMWNLLGVLRGLVQQLSNRRHRTSELQLIGAIMRSATAWSVRTRFLKQATLMCHAGFCGFHEDEYSQVTRVLEHSNTLNLKFYTCREHTHTSSQSMLRWSESSL